MVAVIAGVAGIVKYFDDRRKAHRELETREVREWQKVIIHKILQRSHPDERSFDALKAEYLQEAQQHADLDIPKRQLSDTALRRVLIEMISAGVVRQSDDDVYWVRNDRGAA